MYNYKLVIQYNGKNYAGWQIQNNAITIQQILKESIEKITREKINLIGAGRTDSGVHALGQIANFKIKQKLDEYKFLYSLNSIIPQDIAVNSIQLVSDEFNSRYDAKSRSYIYLISDIKSPFYYDFAYYLVWLKHSHIDKLNYFSSFLIGEKDFTSFTKHESEIENKVAEVFNIHWRKSKFLTIFYIEGNRFLHGMVRAIVGTLLHSVKENLNENYLIELFQKKNRELAGISVPAKGLFLYKVKY